MKGRAPPDRRGVQGEARSVGHTFGVVKFDLMARLETIGVLIEPARFNLGRRVPERTGDETGPGHLDAQDQHDEDDEERVPWKPGSWPRSHRRPARGRVMTADQADTAGNHAI